MRTQYQRNDTVGVKWFSSSSPLPYKPRYLLKKDKDFRFQKVVRIKSDSTQGKVCPCVTCIERPTPFVTSLVSIKEMKCLPLRRVTKLSVLFNYTLWTLKTGSLDKRKVEWCKVLVTV